MAFSKTHGGAKQAHQLIIEQENEEERDFGHHVMPIL